MRHEQFNVKDDRPVNIALAIIGSIASSLIVAAFIFVQWELVNVGIVSLVIVLFVRSYLIFERENQSSQEREKLWLFLFIGGILGGSFLVYFVWFIFNIDVAAWADIFGFRNIMGHFAGHYLVTMVAWLTFKKVKHQLLFLTGFILGYEMLEMFTLPTYFFVHLGDLAWSVLDTIVDLIVNASSIGFFYTMGMVFDGAKRFSSRGARPNPRPIYS